MERVDSMFDSVVATSLTCNRPTTRCCSVLRSCSRPETYLLRPQVAGSRDSQPPRYR